MNLNDLNSKHQNYIKFDCYKNWNKENWVLFPITVIGLGEDIDVMVDLLGIHQILEDYFAIVELNTIRNIITKKQSIFGFSFFFS